MTYKGQLFTSRRARNSGSAVQVFQRQFEGVMLQHKAIALRGHLQELDFARSHRTWSSCDPQSLLREAPVEKSVREGMRSLEKQLQQESRSSHAIILWLDCDREGENIAAEARDACLQANRSLAVYRARFRWGFSFLFLRSWMHKGKREWQGR